MKKQGLFVLACAAWALSAGVRAETYVVLYPGAIGVNRRYLRGRVRRERDKHR